MLSSKVACTLLQRVNKAGMMQLASVHIDKRGIGEREVVGFGVNAIPHYIDRVDYPFPSVRFKDTKGIQHSSPGYCYLPTRFQSTFPSSKTNNPDVSRSPFQALVQFLKKPLKEKEKGDWKNLTIEEKKALYRASFCQTFSEFQAPTGEWKKVVGWVSVGVGVAIWLMLLMKKFVYPPLPESFSEESRRAQLRRMLDLKVNPVTGISSQWDYEKDDWKK